MSQKDPYEILGVKRTASADEIKRAYRRLAKENHPDRNLGNKAAEQRFKDVQAAYEVVGDPKRRAEYDRFGAGGPIPDFQNWDATRARRGTGGPFGGVEFDVGGIDDLGSIFEQFFARGRAGAGPRTHARARRAAPAPRGADVELPVQLTLAEALHGVTRAVVLQSPETRREERIDVRIPAGVKEGQRIRVRGQGQPGPGGRGDLMIRCAITADPLYQREGDDLLLDLPISLLEAIEGAQIDLRTPRGERTLTIPPGTSGGTRLRLRNEGFNNPKTGESGHLYVRPRIVLPTEIDEDTRARLRELPDVFRESPRRGAAWNGKETR